MNEASSNQGQQPINASLKKNSIRAALGLTVCSMAFSKIMLGDSNILSSAVFIICVLYVLLSTIWLRIAKQYSYKNSYYNQIHTADAACASAVLAYYFHSIPVSAIVLSALIFNSMIIGSIRQTLTDTSAFFAGAMLPTFILSLAWNNELVLISSLLLMVGIISYLCFFAHHIQLKFSTLNRANKRLYNDLVLHKVRTYKLSRYVTPTVWSALNQDRDESLKTERKRVSVFFSDIEGFSELSEELEAEALADILNTYLTEMVKIATTHRGTIDKFMGDGLMVIFGDTNSDGMKADCLRCVSMAIDMRKKMKELETIWFNRGIKKPLKIRMGINSGYCTVGTFGTSEYMDYTVLGTHVNLASRLESAAESGEILISHETWSLIKDVVMCRDRGEIKAKGFSHPIKVYQVTDFRKNMGLNQSYFEEHMQGFSMHLDLDKVKNYDRERIVEQLEEISEKLRDKYS